MLRSDTGVHLVLSVRGRGSLTYSNGQALYSSTPDAPRARNNYSLHCSWGLEYNGFQCGCLPPQRRQLRSNHPNDDPFEKAEETNADEGGEEKANVKGSVTTLCNPKAATHKMGIVGTQKRIGRAHEVVYSELTAGKFMGSTIC